MDLISKDTLRATVDTLIARATDVLVPALRDALRESLDGLTITITKTASPETVWQCSGCLEYRFQGQQHPPACPACGHMRFRRERG